ncbi:MAG TPA: cadmium-translocating P-type ATPase [Firmicutes bacterium]|nr:cadmium-translocating P-type ATPase [Candidatus Fermentithermobacillaceae bacterium]
MSDSMHEGSDSATRQQNLGEHGSHSHEHGHAHSSHTHSHVHDCGCDHCHTITLAHEPEPNGGIKGLLPPLFGIIGIGLGFIVHRLGYSAYRVPYLFAAVVAGYPVARAGLRALLSGAGADINLLTTVAGIGAMVLGEWAEGAAVLTLFSIGEYLEEKAGERTRKSIRDIMGLSPLKARVKVGDRFSEVAADEVTPGDIVVVFPGEKIPVDGEVVSGASSVDQSQITGESIPVDKLSGSDVFAGSLNGEGTLDIRVTRMPEDTTLARIITMVEESQSKRAKSHRLVDNFARYWTPLMLVLSVTVAVGVPLVFKKAWRPWIYRGLTVLIVSCPCSLVISTPVTVVASIARAAKNGVLIKGGAYLEALGRVKAVALDKTGTVTEGRVAVDQVIMLAGTGVTTGELLGIAAAVESRSDHPLAKAMVDEADARGVDFVPGKDFTSVRGKGAYATLHNRKAYVGSEKLFEGLGIDVPACLSKSADGFRQQGKTVVFVGSGQKILGAVCLSDAIRREAREAISNVQETGAEAIMLTGDDMKTAMVVAAEVGIGRVEANLMPQDKLAAVGKLMDEFGSVAMVGDGVNDAPSLAAASVGIAMEKGADVALETAGVALMKNDLRSVPWAMGLARKTRKLIIQNVSFSVAIKLLALVMVFGGVLPLWLAVLADSGAAVLVTFNGLRILGHK